MVDDGHHNNALTSKSSDVTGASHLPQLAANETTTTTTTFVHPSNATSTDKELIHREPLSTMFPHSKQSVKKPLISQHKFHWDQTEQGHILGAFFYGYILFQIPGARLAESVGAKWILLAANAGSAVVCLIFPLSTQLNSIHLLMMLRFVMGLCQSAFFPAAYVVFCRWLPEKERAILLPIMFIGSNMGSVSTYIMSSYLISSSYGWPSVFYVSGLICALVTIMWSIFGSNAPADNWFITEEECLFIEGNVNNQSSETNSLNGHMLISNGDQHSHRSRCGTQSELDLKKGGLLPAPMIVVSQHFHQEAIRLEKTQRSRSKSVNSQLSVRTNRSATDVESVGGSKAHLDEQQKPHDRQLSWNKLLKSVPVWTLILSMYGNEWSNAVICYELPTYLNTALDIPIEENGVINSFFQLSFTLVSPVVSSLGAYLLDRHVFGMHKIHVRKLFQSLATFGQLACFVSVPICGANRGLIIMFMFAAIVFKACANAGDIMVPGDLSPEYAGTIFAFCNTIGNTAGFLVPILAAAFITDAYERAQWTPFWMTTAAIMGCSGLIFLICGETSRQDLTLDSGQLDSSSEVDDDEDRDGHEDDHDDKASPASCCLEERSKPGGQK